MIITDANAAMRVHDRMPVILATDAARRWMEPGPLPAELLVPLSGRGDAGLARRRRREEQQDRAAPGDGGGRAGIGRLEGLANARPSAIFSIDSVDIRCIIG